MIILASGSPRRKEILEKAGVSFKIVVQNGKEVLPQNISIERIPEEIAAQKGKEISSQYPTIPVLCADTIVTFQGKIYGKPKDEEDAYLMLKSLSGNTHEVITGCCLFLNGERIKSFHSVSHVLFYELTEETIRDYIKTKDPFDKAGAYGIQSSNGKIVKSYDGEYENIVGLPIQMVLKECKEYL